MRKILIDVHEPEHIETKIHKLGIPTERCSLKTGDLVLGEVLIERKTITDFWGTLEGGRLFEQLYKMMCSDKKRLILVIVGNNLGRRADISKREMEQRIKEIGDVGFISFGILFKRFELEEDFLGYIKWAWERCNQQSYAPTVKKGKRTLKQVKAEMLARVDGIGVKLANELAENFTFEELAFMDLETLQNYKFSGRKLGFKATNLKLILNEKRGEQAEKT